jgi:Nif-specific regulatory protein
MVNSFSEFKFYQAFRIPVEKADGLRFIIEIEDQIGKTKSIDDGSLVDISVGGLGFSTEIRLSVGVELRISLQFKKMYLDLTGRIVRAFSNTIVDNEVVYGVELDEDQKIARFLEQYVSSFSSERLRECLVDSLLEKPYTSIAEGFETFSLLLSLFKDISRFGDNKEFVASIVEEVVRVMDATRSTIFLINTETNELEALTAVGVEAKVLKFDYRLGIAGSVFTTGVALNINTTQDKSRFNENFDNITGFETRSIICHPIHNREDKIIGVIEVLNKRNKDRFSIEDEKTMKVLTLIFSSIFHDYNPVSEKSQIRNFSSPYDREKALVGETNQINSLRNTIVKLKDLESPVLVSGEKGVGKNLYCQILHSEGARGLKHVEVLDCSEEDPKYLEQHLLGKDFKNNKLLICQGGTLVLKEVSSMPLDLQRGFFQILKNRLIPQLKLSLDVRILATTSKEIGELVEKRLFDKDFYHFLSKAYISIIPLRRRSDDIVSLTDYFLRKECKRQGLLLKSFSKKALDKLVDYEWPGNISELKTCVERAVLYNPKSHIITEEDMGSLSAPLYDDSTRSRVFGELPFVGDPHILLKDRIAIVEREMILMEIKRNNDNKSKAAKEMGISREALRKKLILSSQVLGDLEEKQKVKEKVDYQDLKSPKKAVA